MARTDTLPHFLTDVADAIRTKTGTQGTIQASSFDTAISNIPSGGGSLDLTAGIKFGYSNFTTLPSIVSNANWDDVTNGEFMFSGCMSLTTIPQLDTSNMTNMVAMFENCPSLVTLPELDTSSCLNLSTAFSGCENLSSNSLNNILAMCINVNAQYEASKTLYELGLGYEQAEVCMGLSNYQDFLNAGWDLGDYELEPPEEEPEEEPEE